MSTPRTTEIVIVVLPASPQQLLFPMSKFPSTEYCPRSSGCLGCRKERRTEKPSPFSSPPPKKKKTQKNEQMPGPVFVSLRFLAPLPKRKKTSQKNARPSLFLFFSHVSWASRRASAHVESAFEAFASGAGASEAQGRIFFLRR